MRRKTSVRTRSAFGLSILFLGAFSLVFWVGSAWGKEKKVAPKAAKGKLLLGGKTASQVIKEMDKKLQGKSSRGEIEMKIITPRWKRTLRMKMWSKGLDYAFVRILKPSRERGMASLKRKFQMWNYLPRAEMVVKIPPSMMMGSWMGSDFTNDDLVRASNVDRDYHAKILKVTMRGGVKQGQILLKPKPNAPVVWGKLIVWVREADSLPTRQEYYNEKGKLVRVMTFSDIKKMDDRKIPTRMEMRTLSKPGHRTVMRYITMRFGLSVKRKVFTLRNLKRKNW